MVNNTKEAITLRAGVIGLGMIGSGVAVSLVHSGLAPTAVYDIRPAAANLNGVPPQVGSPAEVARLSDVVLIAVVTAEQAEDVLSGENGVLAANRDDLIVVLLSTVSTQAVQKLFDLCARHGAVLLDAGVTGGTRAAQNGLVVMVGGPDEAVARAMPVLGAFAKTVVHCGGSGTGMVAKLARNAITYGQWAIIHEAAALAQAGGVTLDSLLRVLVEGDDEGSDRLNLLKGMAVGNTVSEARLASADYLAQKDLAAAQEFAASIGLETPLVDMVRPRLRNVYAGVLEEPLPQEARERGLAMMDRTYGKGFNTRIPSGQSVPSIDHTVEQLFAEVWARPYLTLRDRRLFTLGVTAMLGRADLFEIQIRGGLANREFTTGQLREIVLQGHYYAGWGNGTVLQSVIEKIISENKGDTY